MIERVFLIIIQFMGKIIGFFVGLIFGPIGALMGLFVGHMFDSSSKFFEADDTTQTELSIKKGMPSILSYILYKTGYNKGTIHHIKDQLIKNFGYQEASRMMMELRNLNTHFDARLAMTVLYELNRGLPFYTKINIVSFLISIFKNKGFINANERAVLSEVALSLGVNPSIFFGEEFTYEDRAEYGRYEQSRNKFKSEDRVDHYSILGVDRNTPNDEIKKRYRELCMKYHPDKTHSLPEAERKEADNMMRKIISSYEAVKKEKSIR